MQPMQLIIVTYANIISLYAPYGYSYWRWMLSWEASLSKTINKTLRVRSPCRYILTYRIYKYLCMRLRHQHVSDLVSCAPFFTNNSFYHNQRIIYSTFSASHHIGISSLSKKKKVPLKKIN